MQGKRKVSSTSEGTNPLWNQQMVLPFVPHNNDFSPESLVTNPDYIVITLFDEVMVSGEFEGRGRRCTTYPARGLCSIGMPESSNWSAPTLW